MITSLLMMSALVISQQPPRASLTISDPKSLIRFTEDPKPFYGKIVKITNVWLAPRYITRSREFDGYAFSFSSSETRSVYGTFPSGQDIRYLMSTDDGLGVIKYLDTVQMQGGSGARFQIFKAELYLKIEERVPEKTKTDPVPVANLVYVNFSVPSK